MILEKLKEFKKCDLISGIGFILFAITSVWILIDIVLVGETVSFIAVSVIVALFTLFAVFAWLSRISLLWIPVAVGSFVVYSCTNFAGKIENPAYIVWAIVACLAGVGSIVFQILEKAAPRKKGYGAAIAFIILAISGASVWGGNVSSVSSKTASAQHELWAVPDKYDATECPEPGTLETITYQTKAYSTDEHEVTKSAYVYLPYGYDENEQYDILYLMHGTGDDESYWFVTYEYNKVMLDNLIYYGDIRPVIVVTPTWYVDGVSEDDPDLLTYTFKDELKNDLIPAVESKYSTYAESTDAEDLIASRDHRAFAGLSRGSSTMWHSAYIGALEYFSIFGAFSGSLTTQEEFAATWTGDYADYDIQYLYNTSGSFDFLLKEHWNSFKQLLENDSRLVLGQNCSFDVFPMVYHHINSWHLALYNALQLFFPVS